jgi:hypothetical protein
MPPELGVGSESSWQSCTVEGLEDVGRLKQICHAKLSLLTSTALVYNCTISSAHDTWEASPSFIRDGALGSEG